MVNKGSLAFRKVGLVVTCLILSISNLFAHHQGGGGGGGGWWDNRQGGGGNEVPEIDGNELPLAIVALVCAWILFNCLKKRAPKA